MSRVAEIDRSPSATVEHLTVRNVIERVIDSIWREDAVAQYPPKVGEGGQVVKLEQAVPLDLPSLPVLQ